MSYSQALRTEPVTYSVPLSVPGCRLTENVDVISLWSLVFSRVSEDGSLCHWPVDRNMVPALLRFFTRSTQHQSVPTLFLLSDPRVIPRATAMAGRTRLSSPSWCRAQSSVWRIWGLFLWCQTYPWIHPLTRKHVRAACRLV